MPDPPHFVQLLPALADSTQQACAHVLPSAEALVQQPATLDSGALSAANMTLAENNEATATAINEFENFFILYLGVVDLVRAAGVEPASHAWEAHIIPIYYARPVGQNA